MSQMMKPSQLRFSQDTINSYFSNGNDINETIERMLRSCRLSQELEDFLPIEVARCSNDGQLYSNNNRRLYMLRVLEKQGKLHSVAVKVVARVRPKDRDVGCHVQIRRGEWYPHCNCGHNY